MAQHNQHGMVGVVIGGDGIDILSSIECISILPPHGLGCGDDDDPVFLPGLGIDIFGPMGLIGKGWAIVHGDPTGDEDGVVVSLGWIDLVGLIGRVDGIAGALPPGLRVD